MTTITFKVVLNSLSTDQTNLMNVPAVQVTYPIAMLPYNKVFCLHVVDLLGEAQKRRIMVINSQRLTLLAYAKKGQSP